MIVTGKIVREIYRKDQKTSKLIIFERKLSIIKALRQMSSKCGADKGAVQK